MSDENLFKFKQGDRVLYVPTHAAGDKTHKDCETGTVFRVPEPLKDTVFVKYHKDGINAQPKGTYVWNLEAMP